MIFFGYTQCPDVCPTTLSELAAAMQGARARRDEGAGAVRHGRSGARHAELLSHYVPAFDPSFLGLYGDADATARSREGIQDHLPEAARRDAGQLHDGSLGRNLSCSIRRGGCASTSATARARGVRARHSRTAEEHRLIRLAARPRRARTYGENTRRRACARPSSSAVASFAPPRSGGRNSALHRSTGPSRPCRCEFIRTRRLPGRATARSARSCSRRGPRRRRSPSCRP